MVLSFSACSKQDANSDITSGTSNIASTETTEENKATENTPESDITESTTESETPQNTTPTKPTESTTTTTNNKPTTTTKPSNTEPKDESTNNKNDTPTTSTPTQKPTEKPTEEKPYYVGFELVSIDRPTTTYKVNGVPLLEKAYGTKYVLQVGDTATFKIIMSDGGNTGFSLRYKESCDVNIEGNLLKLTANAGYSEKTDVYIDVDTKDGSKAVQLPRFINTNQTIDYTEDGGMLQNNIFVRYATRNGLIDTNLGIDLFDEIKERKDIDSANNPYWITEVFNTIDGWLSKGYTKFSLIVFATGVGCSGGY